MIDFSSRLRPFHAIAIKEIPGNLTGVVRENEFRISRLSVL